MKSNRNHLLFVTMLIITIYVGGMAYAVIIDSYSDIFMKLVYGVLAGLCAIINVFMWKVGL